MADRQRTFAGMLRGWRLAVVGVALGCLPVPAAAEPVTVLMDEVRNGSGANSASTQIDVGGFDTNAVVHVAASGRATYQGPLGGAGILVSIDDGRDVVVRDDSFEGQSINMVYHAAVSRTFTLPRRAHITIVGRTDPLGSQASNNQSTSVRLEVVVVAAE